MSGLKLTQVEKIESNGFKSSQLVLLFEGKNTSPALVNSMRRASLMYVPTYVFAPNKINIEKNTSVLTNDMLRLQVSQLVIPKLNNPITSFDDVYNAYIKGESLEEEKNIYITINVKNDTDKNLDVTSNMIKYFEDNEEKVDYFKKEYPASILVLKPGQEFICNARAELNVGKISDIYGAAANSFYTYDKESDYKYMFTIRSQGQLDEYDILHISTGIMIEKLLNLKRKLKLEYGNEENNPSELKTLEIELLDEDSTLCEVVKHYLQDNASLMSTKKIPDLLEDKTIVSASLYGNAKSGLLDKIYETIDHIINIYNDMNKQINKLGRKYITKH